MKSLLWALATLLAAHAYAADSGDDERALIARERADVEARFLARDKECRERFVVSACVEEVRRERRVALDALKSRQRVLDETRRRERAETRRAELAAKSSEDVRRESERTARAASAAEKGEAKAATPPRPPASSPRWSGRAKPAARETAAERRAREAESRAAFAQRKQQVEAHRQEAAAKAAERAKKRPPAKPLPAP